MVLAAATRLGPYEIVSPLGAGGMGEVYSARDTRLDRTVALKVLPEEFFEDEERKGRFEREAKLLAVLNHPNIAGIFAFEELSGRHLLAMELVDGEGLDRKIARGPLPVEEGLSIARQIAGALEAAHEKGIVHRDLKPANVKVSESGEVKLLDFGLAKALEAGASNEKAGSGLTESPTMTARATAAGVILGTAAYMSPEQARGKSVDRRTDVWAFGCVLYEMLTGRRAFEGETVSDTLAAVLRGEPDFARLPPGTPPGVVRLLRRTFKKDARQRLRDIGDARLELDEAEAQPEAPPGPAAQAPPRRGLGAALLLASLLLGAGVALLLSPRRPPPPSISYLTFSGSDTSPAVSPDGKTVAFASARDGLPRIWLKQLASGSEVAITAGPDRSPRFSPDGGTLLFERIEGGSSALFRQAVIGGDPRRVVDDALFGDFFPEGKEVVFVRRPSGGEVAGETIVAVVPIDGGVVRELGRFPQILGVPRVSPDGKTIALVESVQGGAPSVVWLLSREGGVLKALPASDVVGQTSSVAWLGRGDEIVYARALSASGAVTGTAARLVVQSVTTGNARTVLYSPYNSRVLDVLGPGRLVFDNVSSRENLREIALGRSGPGEPRWLTRGSSNDRQPVFSPDGEWILFSSNRSGNLDLWTLSRRTGAIRRITDDAAEDWDPGFTRDGKRILWSSNRSGHFEVWMADADGSNARQVSNDGVDAENPTATPDGSWIVYSSGNPQKIGLWKIRPDGRDATRLFDRRVIIPDISPDGTWVAVPPPNGGNRANIQFVRVSDGTPARAEIPIPGPSASDAFSVSPVVGRPRWMPGGRALVFVGRDEAGTPGLFVQDFHPERDTTATRRKLAGFTLDPMTESFAIAPDGKSVVIAGFDRLFSLVDARDVAGIILPRR